MCLSQVARVFGESGHSHLVAGGEASEIRRGAYIRLATHPAHEDLLADPGASAASCPADPWQLVTCLVKCAANLRFSVILPARHSFQTPRGFPTMHRNGELLEQRARIRRGGKWRGYRPCR